MNIIIAFTIIPLIACMVLISKLFKLVVWVLMQLLMCIKRILIAVVATPLLLSVVAVEELFKLTKGVLKLK